MSGKDTAWLIKRKENVRKYITDQIKSVVGIASKVSLVAPKSIPRSEGKAKRVIDKRNLHEVK